MMTIILTTGMFLTSMSLTAITHPVNMAGMLIMIALLSSVFLGKLIMSWMLYLLALVFLGGVMVVLLFMVSVCANEKFFFKKNNNIIFSLPFWLLACLMMNKTSLMGESMIGVNLPLVLYQSESLFSFIIFMGILVLCLFSVVKISKLESGPLVKRL